MKITQCPKTCTSNICTGDELLSHGSSTQHKRISVPLSPVRMQHRLLACLYMLRGFFKINNVIGPVGYFLPFSRACHQTVKVHLWAKSGTETDSLFKGTPTTWCVQVLRSPKEAFAAAIQSWREQCEKCVCLQGDYIEKLLHFQLPVVSSFFK